MSRRERSRRQAGRWGISDACIRLECAWESRAWELARSGGSGRVTPRHFRQVCWVPGGSADCHACGAVLALAKEAEAGIVPSHTTT